MNWLDIALGLGAITLLLAFFSFSDGVGRRDHPPPEPPETIDSDDLN